jgi:hypothetical protein
MRLQRFFSLRALLAVFLTSLSYLPAGARDGNLIAAAEPEFVLSAAGRVGEAELGRDELADPLIRGRIGDRPYFVYFYGCQSGRACTNLMFSARWESDHFTDKSMGDWNRKKRFGKAYLDADGNPALELNVNLFGGVSRANLDDTFDWWRLLMAEFAEYYGF